MADDEACSSCRYWRRYLNDDASEALPLSHTGECRRRAPTADRWPVTFADWWCGEYERGRDDRARVQQDAHDLVTLREGRWFPAHDWNG